MVTTRTGRDVRHLGFVGGLIKTSVQIMVKWCVWDGNKMAQPNEILYSVHIGSEYRIAYGH